MKCKNIYLMVWQH